jgi:uncharacterized protein (TIGR02246 family)
MNARTLKTLSVLAGVFVVPACSGKTGSTDTSRGASSTAAAPANDPAVRQQIDSADRKFEAAFKNGDAATAASFYEENATSMPPNMEAETGRAAIEKGFAEMFKSIGKVSDFKSESKDVDAYGDHVVEIGSYDMTFTPTGAKDAVKDHGSYINYWRKQPDGTWKIHRDAIVSATPMPNPGPPPAGKKK